MRRRILLTIGLSGTFFVGGFLLLYGALVSVPDFYSQALEVPTPAADKAGDEFSAGAVALAGDVRREGQWSALFTDEQINGWLAVDLERQYPNLLPPEFSQPRVKLVADHAQIGIRARIGGVKTVAWLDVEARMTDADEVVVRFRKARAGKVPLPLSELLEAVSKVARDFNLTLRWTTTDGDPTAVVGLPPLDDGGLSYELTKLKLADGKLYLAGKTTKSADASARRATAPVSLQR